MTTPSDRRYTREHEWVLLENGGRALAGITHHAQDQLGDIVYLDLPKPGTPLKQSQKLGEVESVKAVSDIYSPVSGEVVEVNAEVVAHPEVVNQDPYGRGWLLRVAISDRAELEGLLSADEYDHLVAKQGH
ncbi:MAG: glycine cleavage system protein GcvH [Chloroflexi bacterium]|nr:glycine cleavage system protein GcvH [Chloroflexota bacterium]